MRAASPVKGVHLVGGFPLRDPARVFELVSATLAGLAPRIPDGASWKHDAVFVDRAVSSHAAFNEVKQAGVLPPSSRLLVVLPTSSVVDIERLAGSIPSSDLAIQWDVMADQGDIELAPLANSVPHEADLLFHLCITDAEHIVWLANRITEECPRDVQLIHMHVPRDHLTDAFFRPLARLTRRTTYSLGLVHYSDGLLGARRRIEMARRYLSEFYIASECDLRSRSPDIIGEFLRLHADIAAGA